MTMEVWLWAAMAAYGAVMLALSPKVASFEQFFEGRDEDSRQVTTGFLVGSVVISWIFAKSVTNAANLAGEYGMVGAVAYAGWYVSIPVVGVVVFSLRRRFNTSSLSHFVTSKYGKFASLAFLLAVLIRLFNEVWSNTAVVAAYFGASGTTGYYAAAAGFAALTVGYSLWGGLRSSILTDAIQVALATGLLLFALGLILPTHGVEATVSSGSWTLVGGVDLLLVGLVQSLSYGFHDPVLTDRSFITSPKKMLRGYLIAGALAATAIVLFGVIGVHAHLTGLSVGEDTPLTVAKAFGVGTLGMMSVLMMLSAGSTLDSTLSSFSTAVVRDLAGATGDERRSQQVPSDAIARWLGQFDPVAMGRTVMLIAIVAGSVPLLSGATILQATTLSGTMVIGLAPVFLLHRVNDAGPIAFHLAFWPALTAGIAFTAGWEPTWLAIGSGDNAVLLGLNLAATAGAFALFGTGTLLDRSSAVDGT
jgi:Na+/proline symporter